MSDSVINFDNLLALLKYDQYNPLMFNTGLFLILFAVFLAIYQLMRKHRTAKFLFVIAFSLYFYYKSSAEYCFILLGVCLSDYFLGILMERCRHNWQKRLIVALNVVINVGMLVWFKYFNLIYETFANFTGRDFNALDIILPAGISFFTFRSISYIVEIYRGVIHACRDFLAYAFYLTFFPPLLAGPVVRAKDMLPQVMANPVASRAMTSEGLFLIMCGLFKKVLVADFISVNFVDRVFDNPALYTGFEVVTAIYGFVIQLYCDFSGYSDMAIGLALLMGYQFLDNFRSPFKSQSPTEFWHRWHISLSTWLRDYVYIPLGGNRCGKLRHHFNLMCTMVIGGLWHGASWMYLIWGALQGSFLVGHKMIRQILPRVKPENRNRWWRRAFNIFITFNLIALSFVFFRARSLEKVGEMWAQIRHNFHLQVITQFWEGYAAIIIVMFVAYAMHYMPERLTARLKSTYNAMPLIAQALVLALLIFVVIQRKGEIVPFIYFQY